MPTIPKAILAGLGLTVLVFISYLPSTLAHISINPLFRHSGLVSHSRPGLTVGTPIIDPNAGTTTQALGHLSAEQWLHGRIPWWNSYAGVGLPLAAEMQSESFFLPFVLLLHFSAGVLYLKVILQILAGIFTFLLLRRLQLGTLAAFLGSVFYAFNGTFAWFAHGEIMPLAFLPLFLLGIEQSLAATSKPQRGGWLLVTFAIALSVYAGFPETAFVDGLLALLWTIVRLAGLPTRSLRRSFLLKICIGGLGGLLLTAPLVVPFLEYLQHSAVSHNNFNDIGNPTSSFLQLSLPYIYGPVEGFIGSDSANELIVNWGNIGGYFGITLIFLAALGLLAERRESALRILLAVWAIVLVARTINFPGTQFLFRLIPGMNLIAIHRNSAGSFEMAASILAAFAIDRWQRGNPIPRSMLALSIAVTALVSGLGFQWGSAMIARLSTATSSYPPWLWGSLAAACLFLVLAAWCCSAVPTPSRTMLLSVVVATECVALYLIPTLSGLRDIRVDLAPLEFLRSHLGWQRAYALGGVHPNYGSYYQVPFIDHESLPVSDIWIDHLRQKLDPAIDAVTFSGDYPPPREARAQALRRNLANFEDAGVRFVAVPRNTDPFEDRTLLPHAPGGNIPVYVAEGEQIKGTLPSINIPSQKMESLTFLVATDGGKADGTLRLQVCAAETCVQSDAGLSDALDNSPLPFRLSQELRVNPGVPLRYTLTHVGSHHPVAIWMFPSLDNGAVATLPNGSTATRTPEVAVGLPQEGQQMKRVFQSATQDVFELNHPAPYFDTAGGCKVEARSNESLTVSCSRPATLIRRELFYPGWKAFVNDREVPVRAQSIFQSIELPAGDSRIDFRYVPTNIGVAYLALLSGIGIVALAITGKLV